MHAHTETHKHRGKDTVHNVLFSDVEVWVSMETDRGKWQAFCGKVSINTKGEVTLTDLHTHKTENSSSQSPKSSHILQKLENGDKEARELWERLSSLKWPRRHFASFASLVLNQTFLHENCTRSHEVEQCMLLVVEHCFLTHYQLFNPKFVIYVNIWWLSLFEIL